MQESCVVEINYEMTEDLKWQMNESAATSLVHTVGQRVFLHNFDSKGRSLMYMSLLVRHFHSLHVTFPGAYKLSQRCHAVCDHIAAAFGA